MSRWIPRNYLLSCANCGEPFLRKSNTRYCSLACRFIHKIVVTDACWIWDAATAQDRYGSFVADRKRAPAHRVAYELWVGPIPEGLHLDHLCRVHACVNPAHLEPVTPRENALRGESPSVQLRRAGMCKAGHEMNDQTRYVNRQGKSKCRPCAAAYQRALKAKRRDAA